MHNPPKYEIAHREEGEWIFPGEIDFKSASQYIHLFSGLDYGTEIVFDLRNTRHIHSSFIGFLIDLKQKTDRAKGGLILRLSPALEKLLSQIDLADHFTLH